MSDTATSEEKSEASKEHSPSDLECIESSNFYVLYILTLDGLPSNEDCHKNGEKCKDSDDTECCLSVVTTNLSDALESEVRIFLLKKFVDKVNLTIEGKYAVLCSRSNLGCYYHFLKMNAVHNELSDNTLSAIKAELTTEQKYVLCFLGSADGTLESFCPEIAKFCSSLQTSLSSGISVKDNHIKRKLDQWHTWAIQFIGSCINLLKSDISVILQLALCGDKLHIICDDNKIIWDLERFLETCSLTSVFSIDSPIDEESFIKTSPETHSKYREIGKRTNNTVEAKIKDGKVTFDPAVNCYLHCQRWSERLLSSDQKNYLELKKTIDDFKLKTIQDLNILKRLLKKAENDHYSFYKAYQFLLKSGYKEILLKKATQEALLSNNLEACELIMLLLDCC